MGISVGISQGYPVSFPFRSLTIDHIIRVSPTGTDYVANLQLPCVACNSVKGSGTKEEFMVMLKGIGLRYGIEAFDAALAGNG